jgi:hypothetical protein
MNVISNSLARPQIFSGSFFFVFGPIFLTNRKTLVVKPEDVSVLASSKNEKTLTLITCTPIDTATHRLIVKAKIKP